MLRQALDDGGPSVRSLFVQLMCAGMPMEQHLRDDAVVEAMSAGLLPFVAKGNNIESILERADLCAIDLLSPLEGVRRAVKEYNPDRLRALFVEHYIVSVFALRVRKALSESQL